MSHDDPFGAPLDPAGYGVVPPDYEPLASGDESVLAASGLNDPPGPANKPALVAIGMTLVLGGLGIAATAGAFRYLTRDDPAPTTATASRTPSASATVSEEPLPSATSAAAKPKPRVLRPLAGKPQPINKANSGTLGKPYVITLPTDWTVARAIRNDRVGNLDLRMRNAAKTHSLSIFTLKPAVTTGPMTQAKLASVKAALYKAEPQLKSLPGTPKGTVAGAAATGFDVTTMSGGKPVTIRTMVWQRGTVTYAASWRVPGPAFRSSGATLDRLLASITFPA